MKLNTPNCLSLLRIVLMPIMVAFMYSDAPWAAVVALLVFVIAALTDYLDGYIARKEGIVTTFGKFIDPLADKMLVLAALIMLSAQGNLPAWVVVLVLFRELAVDGIRLIANQSGRVIAASKLGKIKTVIQMVTIILLMLLRFMPVLNKLCGVMVVLMALATIISGIDYFVKNKDTLTEGDTIK